MPLEIIPIRLPMPLNISQLNSYLLKTENGFFLVDTGYSNSRRKLEPALAKHGCQGGNLKLIILTHGDFDHTGNAVYLRRRFGTPIAMHVGDEGMLELGDMFWNRKTNYPVVKMLVQLLIRFKGENRGKPDIYLEDGASLAEVGLDALVYNTPGHSRGSICILAPSGELFCGDLFINSTGKPMINSMLYDRAAGHSSFERLKNMSIKTVYPGHGAPFSWQSLLGSSMA